MTAKLVWTISKEALKLVKAGKAFVSSGGVRLLNGTMFEMVKPVVNQSLSASLGGFVSGPIGAGLNLASSLASNVQCAIIQKGVNSANIKLDDVIQRLGRLETAMQSLHSIQMLSWANMALSLANSGISIVGFYKTLHKLSEIEDQTEAFFDRYQQDRKSDAVEQFRIILLNLRNDINYLQQKMVNDTFDEDSFIHREPFIEEHLNSAAGFIKRILSEFTEERIDGRIGCQIIFVLSSIFAQDVNEYCCQYYYVHHIQHALFQDWAEVLDEINSSAFIESLKNYLAFAPEYAMISPLKKNDAVKVALESISEHQNRLASCAQIIRLIPESGYIQLDNTLDQGIFAALSKQTCALSDENITLSIMNASYNDADEYVTVAAM